MGLTLVTGTEIASKIMAGERDFRQVRLATYGALSDELRIATRDYLLHNSATEPDNGIDFRDSELIQFDGREWTFGYARFDDAIINEARLCGSIVLGASFARTQMCGVDFRQAYLGQCMFERVGLVYAKMEGLKAHYCSFDRVMINSPLGAESAVGLETCTFTDVASDRRFYDVLVKRLVNDVQDPMYVCMREFGGGWLVFSSSTERFIKD